MDELRRRESGGRDPCSVGSVNISRICGNSLSHAGFLRSQSTDKALATDAILLLARISTRTATVLLTAISGRWHCCGTRLAECIHRCVPQQCHRPEIAVSKTVAV